MSPLKRLHKCILLLFIALILGISTASAFEVSPSNPTVGDTITISGTSSADSVKANVEFTKTVPVKGGEYKYRINDVEIPKGSNTFMVKAEGVEDLNVRVKILFWITKSAEYVSSSGVARVSQSNVPSGTYDIQIDGPAATGTSSVDLTITASQNIDVENGVFKGEYNTISIPPGQFKVTVAGETKTITLRSPGSSSGGSGSSGGGGGSTPDSSDNNVDVEELSTKRVFSNTPVEFRFSNPEVPIKSINLTSAITVMNVPVRIEVLKDTSVMVKKEPNGNVYKHINIWVGNAGFAIPENIKSAKVIFQVENNWIEDNNIDNIEPKSVVLMHYEEDADQWTRLPTDMISKNDQYTLYQANVTHFSPFAIAGEARQTTNTDNQTDSNQTNTTAENGQQDSSETPANSRQGLNAEWILIGGVVAGLVAMTAWKMKKNRQ